MPVMIHWNQLGTGAMPWYLEPYNGVSWCNCSSQPFCRFSDVEVVEAIFKTNLCAEFGVTWLRRSVQCTAAPEKKSHATAAQLNFVFNHWK